MTASFAAPLRADGGGSITPENWPRAWVWEPGIVTVLFVSAALYASGLRFLRQATGVPHKLRGRAWWFASGWLLVALALVSPIHPLGRELFSAHMAQHELLMVVAAPLLVLGRPGRIWLWSLPPIAPVRGAVAFVHALAHSSFGRLLGSPIAAGLAHAVALWAWHAPRWYEATLGSERLHAFQHACFFGTAVWLWQTLFFAPGRRVGYGLAIVCLLTTALHTGALGALITLSTRPWYPHYTASAAAWGLAGQEDQQLGGVIMWVPAGLAYVVAALALVAAWMREAETSGPPPSAHPDRRRSALREPGAS